jgi:phage gp29-like protein
MVKTTAKITRNRTAPTVKVIPSIQTPADGQPLVRGGTASGTPGQIIKAWNRWRENYNALVGLTIARVRALNEMTQRGDHAYPQWTYRTIERRHPVLKALIESCESPIENYDWDVKVKTELPEGCTDADAEKQRAALKAAYNQIDNLTDAIIHITHADFPGYSLLQKHRATEGAADGGIVHLEPLFQYCICRDGLFGDWFWNPDSRALTMPGEVLTEKNRIGGDVLPREDFIIREVPRPIDEIALENYVRRKLIEKDWSAFDEIFGIPSGVITMPPGIPKELEAAYEAAAKAVAEGGSGAIPNGSSYTANDQPRDGSNLFKNHMAQLDEDLVLAATGGKLTMLVQSGGGSQRGSSKVQENIFDEIAEARAGRVSKVFQKDFDSVFIAENFPGQPVLVEFQLVAKDNIDVGQICTNVASLKTAGKNVDTDWLAQQTGYEFTDDDDAAAPPTNELPAVPGEIMDVATLKNIQNRNRRHIRNRDSAGADDIATTLHETLLPILKRLDAISKVADAGIQQTMIEKLLADFPAIAEAIQADDSLAKKLSPHLATALVTGLKAARVTNRILNADWSESDHPRDDGGQFTDAPPRISAAEADAKLTAGFTEKNAVGEDRKFGLRAKQYLEKKPDAQQRKEHIEWARETVRSGKKSIVSGNEVYAKVFLDNSKQKGILTVASAKDGEVFDWYRKDAGVVKRKFMNRQTGGQSPEPVLQAIATAGGLPDWFHSSPSNKSVKS